MSELQIVGSVLGVCVTLGGLLWKLFSVAAQAKMNKDTISRIEALVEKHDGDNRAKFKELYERTDNHSSTLARLAETVETLQKVTIPRIEKKMDALDAKLDKMLDKLDAWRSGK